MDRTPDPGHNHAIARSKDLGVVKGPGTFGQRFALGLVFSAAGWSGYTSLERVCGSGGRARVVATASGPITPSSYPTDNASRNVEQDISANLGSSEREGRPRAG
jgi:hypothetical protein